MPQYLVESPHTKEECLKALDELAKEREVLDQTWFGCVSGDHTGYTTVEAGNESEAKHILPDFLQDKARVIEVTKLTPEKIESFHRM